MFFAAGPFLTSPARASGRVQLVSFKIHAMTMPVFTRQYSLALSLKIALQVYIEVEKLAAETPMHGQVRRRCCCVSKPVDEAPG